MDKKFFFSTHKGLKIEFVLHFAIYPICFTLNQIVLVLNKTFLFLSSQTNEKWVFSYSSKSYPFAIAIDFIDLNTDTLTTQNAIEKPFWVSTFLLQTFLSGIFPSRLPKFCQHKIIWKLIDEFHKNKYHPFHPPGICFIIIIRVCFTGKRKGLFRKDITGEVRVLSF